MHHRSQLINLGVFLLFYFIQFKRKLITCGFAKYPLTTIPVIDIIWLIWWFLLPENLWKTGWLYTPAPVKLCSVALLLCYAQLHHLSRVSDRVVLKIRDRNCQTLNFADIDVSSTGTSDCIFRQIWSAINLSALLSVFVFLLLFFYSYNKLRCKLVCTQTVLET